MSLDKETIKELRKLKRNTLCLNRIPVNGSKF